MQSLQYAVNRYWPDYVVALEQTAWSTVVEEEWFTNAYTLEAKISISDDPVAPVRIFRRRDQFPPREFALDSAQDVWYDGAFALRRLQVAQNRVSQGEPLVVQLTLDAGTDIDTAYLLGFRLVGMSNGQQYVLASRLPSMRGGNPSWLWRQGDRIVDLLTLAVPPGVEPGLYSLEVDILASKGDTTLSDGSGHSVDSVAVGPMQLGAWVATEMEPAHPVSVNFEDNMVLSGYDVACSATDSQLSFTLFWEARDVVSRDYTAFVHLLSPEGETVAQRDDPPLLPTSHWTPESGSADLFTLPLPEERESAGYAVQVGFYSWPDLERVGLVDSDFLQAAEDAVLLGRLHFENPGSLAEEICTGQWWQSAQP